MFSNNAVTPDVCTQGRSTCITICAKGTRSGPRLASPVFFGAPLQSAWAPTSCIRRIYRTEAAAVGWRACVCAGVRVHMF